MSATSTQTETQTRTLTINRVDNMKARQVLEEHGERGGMACPIAQAVIRQWNERPEVGHYDLVLEDKPGRWIFDRSLEHALWRWDSDYKSAFILGTFTLTYLPNDCLPVGAEEVA